jgi:gamma-polyglutamate biosynthesis protein CapC
VELWLDLQDRRTLLDGRADLVQPENKQNLFHLTHQVLLRESGTEPQVILQSRAFGPRPNRPTPTADVLFMTSEGQASQERMSPLAQQVIQTLQEDGLHVQAIYGSPDTAGFEAGGVAQALYLNQTRNKEFVVLWASPQVRARYQWQTESALQAAQFRALGIPSVVTDLYTHLTRLGTKGRVHTWGGRFAIAATLSARLRVPLCPC